MNLDNVFYPLVFIVYYYIFCPRLTVFVTLLSASVHYL